MTWQDELQHLDAELAAGRISAEEYRQRRDALLARTRGAQNEPSSGGFPQQQPSTPSSGMPQQPGTPSGGTPQQQPGTPAGGAPPQNPFPPPFSWGDAAAQGARQQGSPDESTEVVPNPLVGPPQPSDSETTQVVSFSPHPPSWGPPQHPWGPTSNWGVSQSTTPPWSDAEPPEHGDAWMRQGPEVFENAGKSRRGKLIAGFSIGAVLVVVLVVAGVFYFTSVGGNQPQANETPQQPPPPTKTLREPPPASPNPPTSSEEVLVAAPGPVHPWNGALDVPSLQGAKGGLLQPQSVRDFALQSGLIDGWFNGTEGSTPKTTLLALRMPDPTSAKAVVQEYLGAQQGLSVVDDLSYQGVQVVSVGGTFRTAYVGHNWAIIIDVSGSADQQQAAQDTFRSVLDQQVSHIPPTIR